VYNGLLKVDFRRLEDIDDNAFQMLCGYAIHGLMTGTSIAQEAARIGVERAGIIINEVERIIDSHQSAMRREALAKSTATNVLLDMEVPRYSWVILSPPEVKGAVLNVICYDYRLTPDRYVPFVDNKRDQAIRKILESSQSWRDYQELVTRMTRTG